jgi:hypothetical protein
VTAKQDHTIPMGKVILFAVILTVLLAALAIAASLVHGVEFDNWAAVAAFFYAAEVIGAVVFYLMLLIRFARR